MICIKVLDKQEQAKQKRQLIQIMEFTAEMNELETERTIPQVIPTKYLFLEYINI